MKPIFAVTLVFVSLCAGISHAKLSSECGELNHWIEESELIVFAEVIEVKTFIPENKEDPNYGDPAVTYTTIAVEEYIKGKGPMQLTIHTKGGMVGNREYLREDQPVFKVGQRGYFFLDRKWSSQDKKKEAKNYRPVCGMGVLNKDYLLWEMVKDEFVAFLKSKGRRLRE